MRLYVHNHVCLNEFIIMLKERFFTAENGYDNIDLEDIWLYKIFTQNKCKTMYKLTYSLEQKYDCPLFSKQASYTTSDWEHAKPK